jgi:cephalosporin hydroxylase
MQQVPTLWDRMSDETRAAIESYEHPHSREFCIDFLKSKQFYTQCTFDQIQTLLIVLHKERTLSNFQDLFCP